MHSQSCRPRTLFLTTALLGTLAVALGGCKTPDLAGSSGALGSGLLNTRSASSEHVSDWRREVMAAGQRYKSNPRDAEAALRYARALRKTDQHAQAAAVLQQAAIHHPRDKRLLGDYGRALAENGQLKEAFAMLDRAHSADQPDWRILSAQGAVLDQMSRHEDARRYYAAALAIVPDEPSVLSNLGLSYALSKELAKSEETLRKAAARGSRDRRVRQNLALVVGLQGRFAEAETIARADLPPAEAAENVAYLQQMLPKQKVTVADAKARSAESSPERHPAPATDTSAARQRAHGKAAQAKSRPLMLGTGG